MRTLAVAVLTVLAACYQPSLKPCAVTCEASDTCPAGLTCGADNYCYRPGEARTCSTVTIDAGDGPTSSADAATDAATDAAPTPQTFRNITAGDGHACGIDLAGKPWCWGRNDGDGGVGVENVVRSPHPIAVETTEIYWTAIDAGDDHTCGIAGGSLYCWGANNTRQAGTTDDSVPRPKLVAGSGTGWTQVSAGVGTTCAIKTNAALRTLWCWGNDDSGQLGDGTAGGNRAAPAEVGLSHATDWDAVSVGANHACALRAGQLTCWGHDGTGQVGAGDDENHATPLDVTVDGVTAWTAVSAGVNFTCAIGDGALYCWGINNGAELGLGGSSPPAETPQLVDDTGTWTRISAGDGGACGLRDDVVQCWGAGERGEIGDGSFADSQAPADVDGLTGVTELASGGAFRCALDGDGHARCWGDNTWGQIGDGTIATKWAPTPIAGTGWKQVAPGRSHTCAIRAGAAGDELACWGRNETRQLGVTGDDHATPTVVATVLHPRAVAAGMFHTCAIDDDAGDGGDVWCWGQNNESELGGGSLDQLQPPHRVLQGDRDFTSVTVTSDATCALRTGGARLCWGFNGASVGQLGFTGEDIVATPTVRAEPPATWRQIALGWQTGCGTTATDQLACWGNDIYGVRGDGATDRRPSILAGTWRQVSTSQFARHACAIATDDTAWCWGTNEYGQTGTTTQPAAPTLVQGDIEGWTAIAAGGDHSCGIAAGDLYCWGEASHGVLGDLGLSRSSVPVALGDGHTWRTVAIGVNHACAITTDDDLYCWGDGIHGQIGDGSGARSRPVLVVTP